MKPPSPLLRRVLVCALCWALAPAPAGADKGHGADAGGRPNSSGDSGWDDEDRSYDRARRATERGEILPLSEIFERALARFPGRVLEAELERKRGRWVYELKVLDAGGRLFEVYLDASTGEVLEHEETD
jgi:hypothetical protein